MNSLRFDSGVRPSSSFASRAWCALALSLGSTPVFLPAAANAADDQEIVAVYSNVFPGYARTRQSDGTFKPETYAFGDGGAQGAAITNPSFDRVRFLDIAQVLASSLATKNYQACNPADPRKTDLLIMVYWGTTSGTDAGDIPAYQLVGGQASPARAALPPAPSGLGSTGHGGSCSDGTRDPSRATRGGEDQVASAVQAANDSAQNQSLLMASVANRQRDRQNAENAAILGYLPELKRVEPYKLTSLNQRHQDVIDEIEESRYYVVLKAYDFQTLLVKKEKKLLWETRYSIRQRRSDFGRQLAAMTQSASRYFGQASAGLVRMPIPGVKVELGELKSLSMEP